MTKMYTIDLQGYEAAETYASEQLAKPKIPSMEKFNYIKFQQSLLDFADKNIKLQKEETNPYLQVKYISQAEVTLAVLRAFQNSFEK